MPSHLENGDKLGSVTHTYGDPLQCPAHSSPPALAHSCLTTAHHSQPQCRQRSAADLWAPIHQCIVSGFVVHQNGKSVFAASSAPSAASDQAVHQSVGLFSKTSSLFKHWLRFS